ncbi:MAG TPA: DUF4350 domain-containing protein [Actinomycetes bacterium]|nr:DUF4350 domain-containing protein [Actinomycetes bacterium]
MSAGAPDAAPAARPRRLRWLPWVLLALAVVLAGWLQRPQREWPPLDPSSPAPDGTKGLVEVLRQLGAEVDDQAAGHPAGSAQTALLLVDDLDQAAREETLAWVRAGGTLVVADPASEITEVRPAGPAQAGFVSLPLPRDCALPALRDAARVEPAGGVVFEVPPGATGCYPLEDQGRWLVAQPVGAGTVVRLGGPVALTNAVLDQEDNALLAAGLLAPRPGTRVAVLRPPAPGAGRRTLADLIAPQVRSALWQLLIAFVVLAAWRGRRLGRPVLEPQAVQIPGSELVVAVGNLLQRSRSRQQAGAILAEDLRRTLATRLGLPASASAGQVAEVAAARTGVDRDRILRLLSTVPASEAELVAFSQTVEAVRREVVRVR